MRVISVLVLSLAFVSRFPASANPVDGFADLLEGRYDNELQVFFDAERRAADAAPRQKRQHLAFQRDGDGPSFRLSIGANESDGAAKRYGLSVGVSGDGQSVAMTIRTAEHDSRSCQIVWRPADGGGYSASANDGLCRSIFGVRATLGAAGLDIVREDGASGNFVRARPFLCWTAVLRGAKHGDTGKGAKDTDWFFTRGVWLHDQGGVATITTDETPARDVRLRLRRVAWPSGPNRPSLTLYVMEPGDDRAVSYAWGEFDAGRLGLNLRWMQASCTYEKDKMWP